MFFEALLSKMINFIVKGILIKRVHEENHDQSKCNVNS